jgi:hypothetical protein
MDPGGTQNEPLITEVFSLDLARCFTINTKDYSRLPENTLEVCFMGKLLHTKEEDDSLQWDLVRMRHFSAQSTKKYVF